MPELAGYNSKFDPEFSYTKFSKETLIKLLKVYSEHMLRIDAFWYLKVMEKRGPNEVLEYDVNVWEKCKPYEMRAITSLLNIQGDDVATVMKYLQVDPWSWNWDYEIDLKNNNHSLFTYRTCNTLFSMEKEGKGREKQQCYVVCPTILNFNAHYFNLNIKVTPLKLPPRESNDDICCQWEFKLER